MAIRYSEPALCHYNHDITKSWFVYFDVFEGDVTIRKQFRGGINKKKDLKKRLSEGKQLVQYWKQRLRDGWSPFESEVDELSQMNFSKALQFALSECKVARSTHKGYRLTIKYILSVAGRMANRDVRYIERKHIKLLLSECVKKYKWSNATYNKNQGYLCSILGRLVEWEIIKFNPAEKIKSLPVVETEKYTPYTGQEKERIREYFYLHHYRYFIILMMTYHAGLRPKEVLSLKIKDVDLYDGVIKIFPEIDLENSKTRKIRKVPINNHLLPFLRELQLENYPLDHYVFGSPFDKGKGNRGSVKGSRGGVMHPDYFKPSLTMIKRDTVTKFWKKIVIDKLGIKKHLYAMKHTGGRDKILAGMDLDALRELYGHSSKFMTEKYAKVVKDVYRKHIIEHSPEF